MGLLGTLKRGLVFVVSAPAGTGKTTLVRMITNEFPCVVESVSYTTRAMRPGEIEGSDYYFIDKHDFEKKIREGNFLEYAQVFGNYYGTSKILIEGLLNHGKHVVLVIDTQGAVQIKKILDAIYIFILPPNLEELHKRLHRRKSETQEAIATRLKWAEQELQMAAGYDYHILNENLETAYGILRSIFIAEEHKNRSK